MQENTKVDKDYVEAFNQGYQLSKELNLKPEILNGLKAGNNRMLAMKEGMQEYQREIELEKTKSQEKHVVPSLDLDSIDRNYTDLNIENKSKDKDMGMEY